MPQKLNKAVCYIYDTLRLIPEEDRHEDGKKKRQKTKKRGKWRDRNIYRERERRRNTSIQRTKIRITEILQRNQARLA